MAYRRSERDPLLEEKETNYETNNSYGSSGKEKNVSFSNSGTPWHAKFPCLHWLYEQREKIPGYGLYRLIRQSSVYVIYVLLIMLLVYLLNQLDRFTISITAKYVGADLGFGDFDCMPKISQHELEENGLTRKFLIDTLMSKCNKNLAIKTNRTLCEDYEIVFPPSASGNCSESSENCSQVCKWGHDGATGVKYQILAGPVFNNLYPIAGVFMGILADRFNRKILLGLSLLFWSIATGLTGFAQNYWMLVLFRMLLAIGAAGCSPFAVSILSDYFPKEFRGTALGVYYWGIYFGYSLAYAIGNSINIVLNWRWVFFISGIMGIALTPFVLFTVKEPERKKNSLTDENTREVQIHRNGFEHRVIDLLRKMLLLLKTFIMPGMFTLCIAGGIRNAGGYVWAYNTQPFFSMRHSDETIAAYMSVIPLVGGSIGAVVGGIISDILVKGRGPTARIWVLIVSQLLAAPFAAGALFLPAPWCFLTLIPSNVFGEMWVGVASAMIVDLAPTIIRTSSIALYLFIITVIGGNFNILVPYLQKGLKRILQKHHDHDLKYDSLKWAVFLTFPALYVVSAFLFLVAFFLMRIDLKIKSNREMSLNRPVKESSIDSDT